MIALTGVAIGGPIRLLSRLACPSRRAHGALLAPSPSPASPVAHRGFRGLLSNLRGSCRGAEGQMAPAGSGRPMGPVVRRASSSGGNQQDAEGRKYPWRLKSGAQHAEHAGTRL